MTDYYKNDWPNGDLNKPVRTTFICSVHGDINKHTINSNIPGYEGHWCMMCCLDKLDELGVQRAQKVDK
jgi:hypothetical protein